MQFVNPLALLVLGFIPVLIVLHRLKPKPVLKPSTTLFLWQEVVKEQQSGFYLQKMKQNLPLLLQILIVILLAVALSQPVWFQPVSVGGDTILVIDTSASMKTQTLDGIRFDQAHQEALQLVEALPEDSQMLIIEAGKRPHIRSSFTNDTDRLEKTLNTIHPTDTKGDLQKALYLALSFMKPDQDDWIFVISDGSTPGFSELVSLHPRIKPIFTTGGEKNIGITKFELRQELQAQDRYEIMVEVKNFTPTPVLTPIQVWVDNRIIIDETVGLAEDETKLFIVPYDKRAAKLAQVFLGLQDDFPADNEAFLILKNAKPINVHLVSQGNFFLEKLLTSFPHLNVTISNGITQELWETITLEKEIVILDRIDSPYALAGNYLMINSFSPSVPISRVGEITNPVIVDWERDKSLLANLDFQGVHIGQATSVQAGPEAELLMETENSGLMYAFQKEGLRAVFLGFDLERSDLPLKVAFPVLMNNILQWLYPQQFEFTTLQTRTGEPYSIPVLPHASEIVVQMPSGNKQAYPALGSTLLFQDTHEIGIYKIIEGSQQRFFSVNLMDAGESDIRSKYEFSPQSQVSSETSEAGTMEWPLWFAFVLGGTAFLMMEWYFWLNRKEDD